MRAVVQRVLNSSVSVDGQIVGKINKGFLVLLGVETSDDENDAIYIADKVAGLRIFEDEESKFNLDILQARGEVLAVSQFTLFGDARKGRRPSFTQAASQEQANYLYRFFVDEIKKREILVQEGIFGAKMEVSLVNDGPVTILLDSKKNF